MKETPPVGLDSVSIRLAQIFNGQEPTTALSDEGSGLEFEPDLKIQPLDLSEQDPPQAWAIDGGQLQILDARSIQVVATRASRVCFSQKKRVFEEQGPLHLSLLGGTQSIQEAKEWKIALALGEVLDTKLLREYLEWKALAKTIDDSVEKAIVFKDGQLRPDDRIEIDQVVSLLEKAQEKDILLVGFSKQSSLSKGSMPLLAWLSNEASQMFDTTRWWCPVATYSIGGQKIRVVAAKLDSLSRFSFRIDFPAYLDPCSVLNTIRAVSNDVGFPGYPYPLSVADQLATCPSWLSQEIKQLIDDSLDKQGIPLQLREAAFFDRHELMERL